jgi:hypothetical protein
MHPRKRDQEHSNAIEISRYSGNSCCCLVRGRLRQLFSFDRSRKPIAKRSGRKPIAKRADHRSHDQSGDRSEAGQDPG